MYADEGQMVKANRQIHSLPFRIDSIQHKRSNSKVRVTPILSALVCVSNKRSLIEDKNDMTKAKSCPSDSIDRDKRHSSSSFDGKTTSKSDNNSNNNTELTTMDADSSTGIVHHPSFQLMKRTNRSILIDHHHQSSSSSSTSAVVQPTHGNNVVRQMSPISMIKAESPSSTTNEQRLLTKISDSIGHSLVSTTTGLLKVASNETEEYETMESTSPLSQPCTSKRYFTNSRERWR